MKILLLGKDGQVGWELQRALAPLGELVAVGREQADLSTPETLRSLVQTTKPQVIVNAAAYTAVDRAETESNLAHRINAVAPQVLAQEADKLGAWLVHYSTDYVFDGSGSLPWQEHMATAPLNVYGQTKLEGEQAIAQACERYLIFRTSWVYAARGGNFAKTMLKLAAEREQLKVIDDQHGAPTGADLIADVSAMALRQALQGNQTTLAGIYHLVASGETSWHGYANHVIAQSANSVVKHIEPVNSDAFPTPAKRPHNSRLNTEKLRSTFGVELPDWRVGVDRLLVEIGANKQ